MHYRRLSPARALAAACLTSAMILPAMLPAETEANLAAPTLVPTDMFVVPEGMEANIWAGAPQLRNPTNMDIDHAGRIWVTEGVNYRAHEGRDPAGDRVVVLADTDGDGQADSSHVFVQEPELVAPLGIAVIDNQIVVSCAPHMLIYTDVDRDLRYDPAVDSREILLTGFNGANHDHSLHSVTIGPDGKWYWNAGNAGGHFTDRSGRTFRIGSAYDWNVAAAGGHLPSAYAGATSDDGHVYTGGFAARMNPDGTDVEIIGYNFRNSYEQAVTSFGDVFQNDNDDPPASRTSFLLEYGNAGFFSRDGKRFWNADRRPGQDIPTAQWRQDDPGAMPSGDVYGAGAPTGIVFYEGDLFGPKWQGTLLSCEAARNVIFSYRPAPDGAGWKLDRNHFFTTNPDQRLTGVDSLRGRRNNELYSMFRPSDVAVGPDGAIYIADWFDPRVGGHADHDDTLSGTIYRLTPTGVNPTTPTHDFSTDAGLVEALRSPAINVRGLAAAKLAEQGADAIVLVAPLLDDTNPYVAARAAFLLARLGETGRAEVRKLVRHGEPQMRIAALRALRRADADVMPVLEALSTDESAAVRRDVAVALRDVAWEQSGPILVELATRYPADDQTYLAAWGIGAMGKESQLHAALTGSNDARFDRKSDVFADLLFTLNTPETGEFFFARAQDTNLSTEARLQAVTALGFNPREFAADAMLALHQNQTGIVSDTALWWMLNYMNLRWKDTSLAAKVKAAGIYDPDNVSIAPSIVPRPVAEDQVPVADVLALTGDAQRGAETVAACRLCHVVDDAGQDYGPNLNGWVSRQGAEQTILAIVNPNHDIAHGYDGRDVELEDGTHVHGIVLAEADPVVVRSMGGMTQMIPKQQVKGIHWYGRSLMLSADQLGLSAQDVADIVAYLAEQ